MGGCRSLSSPGPPPVPEACQDPAELTVRWHSARPAWCWASGRRRVIIPYRGRSPVRRRGMGWCRRLNVLLLAWMALAVGVRPATADGPDSSTDLPAELRGKTTKDLELTAAELIQKGKWSE